MSLKTKLLELFKYEPDKDGAQTFNIKIGRASCRERV